MEEKNKQNSLQTYKKASLFKRFVCLLLVLSMMLSMTGCVYIDGQPVSLLEGAVYVIGGFLRAGTLILGDFAILGVTWVLDKITWPLYPVTGFNMDKPAGFLFRTWHRLIDPNKVHGDWSDMGEAEFHEEHPLTIWEKRKGETETDDDVQIQATTDPTQPTESHDKKGGIPNTGGNPPDGIPIIEDGQSIPKTGDEEGFFDQLFDQLIDPWFVTISYDANGGYNAPQSHKVWLGGFQYLAKEKPFRPGYHFIGWSIAPTSATANHQPGERYNKNTSIKATHDTTLYAVWKPFDGNSFLLDHKYTVEQVVEDKQNTNLIRITCSCGLTVTDKALTRSQLLNLKYNFAAGSLTQDQKNEINRLYTLYKAQYVGTLALMLNTSFYMDTSKADYQSTMSNLFTEISNGCIAIDHIKIFSASDYDHLKTFMTIDETSYKAFVSKLGDGAKKVSFCVTALQTANAIQKMADSEKGVLEQTIGMLDLLDCASSFLSFNLITKYFSTTVRAGLSLVAQCAEYRNAYYSRLEFASNYANGKTKSLYLNYIFDRIDLENIVGELITGSPVGCKHSPTDEPGTGCRFYSGAALQGAPTVYEILSNISSWPSQNSPWEIQPEEEEIILFYLAERSRHELYELTGLTVEEYAALIG